MRTTPLLSCAWLALALIACKDDGPHSDAGHMKTLAREELMDPQTCEGCHPDHYREWSSSMHAYALEDPVFLAMNARGQREAELGEFCVNCHAPLAVREGYAKDGKNLEDVPKHLRGVTCYFCHNVESVDGTHNNPIELANDTTMRGSLRDPKRPSAHGVAYSKFLDGTQVQESSKMCGSCHDIVTPAGVHLERTYAEWQDSLFSHGKGAASCNSCHMDGREGIAADDKHTRVPSRRIHSHLFPGVDLALTPFPDREVQRKAVECALGASVRLTLCPSPGGQFEVLLETNAGHRLPSGASQDRRMWVEFVAYDDNDKVIFESGVIPDGDVVDKPKDHPAHDPRLWVLRDRLYDADGGETHMFWEAAASETYPDGYSSQTLPQAKQLGTSHTTDPRTYTVPPTAARVRVRVNVQPMGREVLDELVASKDLAAAVAEAIPTLTLSGSITEWNVADGYGECITQAQETDQRCPDDYLCMLYPDLPQCD
jgi:Cytochrome c554 and c-prime